MNVLASTDDKTGVKKTVHSFYFESPDALLKELKKAFPDIEKNIQKNDAREKICELGFAFSIDSFSQAIREKNTDLCELFLRSEINFDGRDSLGIPLLNTAVRTDNTDIAQELLKRITSIDTKSLDRGYSPLMDAVWKVNPVLVKLLVEAGSDVNFIADDGQSVLILATGTDNYTICETLVNAGADCRIKDKMGMSALDYARLFKKEQLLRLYEKACV